MAFHHNHFNHFTDQQHQPPPPLPQPQQQEQHFHESTPPDWLLRSDNNFLNLHTAASVAATSSDSPSSTAANQWLSRSSSFLQRVNNNNNAVSCDIIDDVTTGGEESMIGEKKEAERWQNARHKAEILSHPLYEQLLSAHVACLRIATPVDQLPRIDAQLAQSQNVVAKYSTLDAAAQGLISGDEKELDHFMTHYVLLLCSFKEQLQQHVRVHAMEAVMACWEIEQSLQSITGVSPGEGTGATMSEDEDEQVESDAHLYDGSLDGLGFGLPTESERSLMERVRQELKHELKQEEDKARLVQETGLQLKQINNWFINQRKRNWHSNPSASTVSKNKRRSNAGERER